MVFGSTIPKLVPNTEMLFSGLSQRLSKSNK